MSQKMKNALALFSMAAVLFVFTGCNQQKPLLSKDAALKAITLEGQEANLVEAARKEGWSAKALSNSVEKAALLIKASHEKALLEVKCNGEAIKAEKADNHKFMCPLKVGENTITIKVTAEDINASKTFTLKVVRNTVKQDVKQDVSLKPFTNDDKSGLVGLALDAAGNVKSIAALNWKYSEELKSYTCDLLPFDLINFALIVRPNNPNAKVSAVGLEPSNRHNVFLLINMPEYVSEATITVLSEDGTTKKDYPLYLLKDSALGIKTDSRVILSDKDGKALNIVPKSNNEGSVLIDSSLTSFTIKASCVSPDSLVGINKEPKSISDEVEVPLTAFDTVVTIKVKQGDGNMKSFKLHLVKPAGDSQLKSLKIDKAPGFTFESVQTVYNDIAVPYGNVTIRAEANDKDSVIKIDGKKKGDDGYGIVAISDTKLKVLVEVINGHASTTYTLNFVKAQNTVNVNVFVADCVGGTKVSGTTLKVYEAGKGTQIGSDIPVTNGVARVTGLTGNKYYDFYLEGIKKQYAGSRVENYFVSALSEQSLTMIQFPHGDYTRGVTPPSITSVTDPGGKKIENGTVVDVALKQINVVFSSTVGAVEQKAWNGYGAQMGIGGAPNPLAAIYGIPLEPKKDRENYISPYKFILGGKDSHLSFPKGRVDLVIVGYDVANNRTERHIYVDAENTNTGSSLELASFVNPFMVVERSSYSLNIYSKDDDDLIRINAKNERVNAQGVPLALDPGADGSRGSYKAIVIFEFKEGAKPIPIIGFDIYRRESGVGNFERVSRVLYGTPKIETNKDWGDHEGFDTDSRLEENKEYEYKIVAFNETCAKESPVMKMKVMEAFTYSLTAPNNRSLVSIADAKKLNYTCKITNPKLLKKEEADFFDTGLLILDGQGEGVFASKFRYVYDKKDENGKSLGKPDLLIHIKTGPYPKDSKAFSFEDDIKPVLAKNGKDVKLEDLVKVNEATGEVTVTSALTQIGDFNLFTGVPIEYKAGTNYQWDMHTWRDNPYNLNNHSAMRIVKSYIYEREDGTKDSVHTRTIGNTGANGGNAINGRFTFTVTQ